MLTPEQVKNLKIADDVFVGHGDGRRHGFVASVKADHFTVIWDDWPYVVSYPKLSATPYMFDVFPFDSEV